MSTETFGTWEAAVAWLLEQPEHAELCRACYYDRPALGAAQRFWGSEEWQAVRRYLPAPAGRALDVGSGMGVAAYALARDGWHTVALEPDPSALVGAQAIRNLAAQAELRIDVVEEWGESLPFDDGTFRLVHARQVLHHARELDRFCSELFRVLQPGGRLVATREHVVSSEAQLPAFLERHALHRYYGGEHAYRLDEYRGALRAAGFQLVEQLGPLQSVINFAPFTEQVLCDEVAARAARWPGGEALARAALARPWRRPVLGLLSALDRRPGRLYTFVADKPVRRAP